MYTAGQTASIEVQQLHTVSVYCWKSRSSSAELSRKLEVEDLSIMGWNVLFLLHLLFCAMAGVHSQDVILDQAFEGEAVHSMMKYWLNAGTSPDLFNNHWNWSLTEHPCYFNTSRASYEQDWIGIYCSTMSYQPEGGKLVQYHSLINIDIWADDYAGELVGGLPSAIENLTNLQYLSISHASKLSGSLPAGLFCLSDVLQNLTLFNCSFNGSVSSGFGPDCVGNSGLQYIDLSNNSFTEMSPSSSSELTLTFFYGLQYLNLSYNQIQGEFSIQASSLQTVDVSNNFITNITFGASSDSETSIQYIDARNNSFHEFPSNLFEYETLQYIYLDSNDISSMAQNFSNFNVSKVQRISMSMNKFQSFPEALLHLPNLEIINLDSNKIQGELYLPNISCQSSKIKSISLLYNNITHLYPSNDTTSCFSESSILLDTKFFLYGNPICFDQIPQTKLLRSICRINATFSFEDDELTSVKKSNKVLLIIVACVSIVAIVIFTMAFFVIQRLRKKISLLHEIQIEFDKRDVKPNLYSLTELKAATQDFHIRNELGRGGFGVVYKGVLPDGNYVAVKKLTKLSMEQGIQDFLSEIIVVSNIKHRNLVQLKGCCIKESQRILVHEFVENKNLADALWGDSRSSGHLDWPTRFNIILGIARGLAYLHEDVQPVIVHRDIKGENILLDKDFNPKIADFGLALFFPSFDDGETHMSVSKVAGTKGYMAPEYLCYGQVSTKLDVFSFGVLLLEIVSGRKKIDLQSASKEQYLVQWAQELYSNDNLPNLKDKCLEEMTVVEDVIFKQVVKVGLQCLHHLAARRPMMSEVVGMLIGNKNVDDCALEDYYEGSSSSYSVRSSNFSFSAVNPSLQYTGKDVGNLGLESHKQSLQMSEVGLLRKVED